MSTSATLPPIQAPLVDQRGILTHVWAIWFNNVNEQTGGTGSTSLASLITTVAEQAVEISTLQTQVSDLQIEVLNGLTVGRQL